MILLQTKTNVVVTGMKVSDSKFLKIEKSEGSEKMKNFEKIIEEFL